MEDPKKPKPRPDFSDVQSGGSSTARPAPPPPKPEQTYTVASGDNLSKIAKKFYGDSKLWRKIFEANKDTIENPDLIYPGQVLKIPTCEEGRVSGMIRRRNSPQSFAYFLMLVLAVMLAFPACQKKEKPAAGNPPATTPSTATTPAVTGVELGKAIQPSKRVVQAQNTFAPADTIYAVVMTEGITDSATLIARWTYEDGQLVDESTQSIMMSGPATTEFHIMKPTGWPAGRYQVQISLNGTPAKSAEFTVK